MRQVTCLKSYSCQVAEVGLESRSFSWQTPLSCYYATFAPSKTRSSHFACIPHSEWHRITHMSLIELTGLFSLGFIFTNVIMESELFKTNYSALKMFVLTKFKGTQLTFEFHWRIHHSYLECIRDAHFHSIERVSGNSREPNFQ